MRLHEETGAARSGVSLSWALFVHPYRQQRQERSSLPSVLVPVIAETV